VQVLAASLIGALILESVIALVIQRFVPDFFGDRRLEAMPPILLTGALSALVLAVLRIERIPQSGKFAVCVFYAFAVTALISAAEVLVPWWADGGRMRGMPWTVMWLLLVPVVVPLGPQRALGRSLALSAVPVLVMFAGVRWFRLPPAPATAYLDLYVPCLIASILAVIVARMMYRLTRQVHEARMMGSYQLEEPIGAGGMGEVWRARHMMLVRPAAVKLIRPERMARVAGDEPDSAVSRFRREAQATASLRSPHTVELYDFGVAEDGTFFYVMELLDGLDLAKFVQRFGPLPAERVIHILSQACDSLADAHASGLVHRDIKPSNVYLCRMGLTTDFVKILDFGLVKSIVPDPDELALTSEQAVLGTPAFLSPEAIAGKTASPSFDIYSLGCVAYWLLTGSYVFESDSPLAMAVAHAKEIPVPPSRKSELPVPEALDRIVLDCLAKDPSDRPASAVDLSLRLSACEVAHPWTDPLAREWWDMHLPRPDGAGHRAPPQPAVRR
jgi:serine/threonine-protein kinase